MIKCCEIFIVFVSIRCPKLFEIMQLDINWYVKKMLNTQDNGVWV